MPNTLLSAYSGEGNTDKAFLGPLIIRVLYRLLLDSPQMIAVEPPVWYGTAKGIEIVSVAIKAGSDGVQLFFAHSDTDGEDFDTALANRIQPALSELIAKSVSQPVVVPLLIAQETEAWMLADIDLLLAKLGGKVDKRDLQLSPISEAYADPKAKLDDIIRQANAKRRRRQGVHKSSLYAPLAEDIPLAKLDRLPSFQRFVEATKEGLIHIGYLRP